MTPMSEIDARASQFVPGPVWRETEEESECWTAEVQALGGYYLIARVHGASEDEARARQAAIIAALQDRPTDGLIRREDAARVADAEEGAARRSSKLGDAHAALAYVSGWQSAAYRIAAAIRALPDALPTPPEETR